MGETRARAGDQRSRRAFLRAGVAGALGASASLSGCIGIILGGGYYQQRARRRALRRRQTGAGPPMSFASQRKRITNDMATTVVHDRSELVSALQTPGVRLCGFQRP